MKYLGKDAYILGIKIYRDRSRKLIGLSRSTYIDKVLDKFSMQDSKRGFLPMSHGISLSKTQCPTTQDERDRMRKIPYASAIGFIMYTMLCTRPDVSYTLSTTSRVPTNDNVVDPLTEPLPQAKHESHIRSMGIRYYIDWAYCKWEIVSDMH